MLGKLIGGFATALVAFALSGGAARADVITFLDLTDTVTFTHTGTSTTITGSCSGETCNLTLSRSGQTIVSTPISFLLAENPALTVFSDSVVSSSRTDSLTFLSAGDGSPILCSSRSAAGCQALESGTPQLTGTITWSGGGTDSIFAESDLTPVPEPGTLALVTIAFAGFGLTRRRRPRTA
jgi:hypothetical protein